MASNAAGTGTAALTLVVEPIPQFTGPLNVSGTAGLPFSYQIAATTDPTSYSCPCGMVPGLTLNQNTGLISGTVPEYAIGPGYSGSTDVVTIQASNAYGSNSAALYITWHLLTPVINSALSVTSTVGSPFYYYIYASHDPSEYSVSGLPPGLRQSFDINTLVSGTPTATGTSAVALVASNCQNSGSATLIITVAPPPSSFNSWQNQFFTPAQLANPAISGETAAPAGDGVPNLLKYAFNVNPTANGTQAEPKAGTVSIGGVEYPTLTYQQDIYATDLTFTPEVSNDLQHWYSGAGYIVPVSVTPDGNGVTDTVVIRSAAPAAAQAQFMRLTVTGP